jgi:hypothetical protein
MAFLAEDEGGAAPGGAAPTAPEAPAVALAVVVAPAPAPEPDFIECETFMGVKMGYIFGRHAQGVGYYKDELTKEKPADWDSYTTEEVRLIY